MANDTPIACSLSASDLERRLAEIAAVGAKSLISRETHGDRHLLRFRRDEDTRKMLEDIVAAEAECCAFLDLSLDEVDGELTLWIAAPRDVKALADSLAGAFSDSQASNDGHQVSTSLRLRMGPANASPRAKPTRGARWEV